MITPRETSWDLSILDIPADDRFRRTLRLYDIDGAERNVTILVRPMGSAAAAEVTAADLTTGCTTAACDAPAYAVVDLDPLVKKLGATRVRVQVVSRLHDARLWAMVTTTNNDTQHVTAYTPQPRP